MGDAAAVSTLVKNVSGRLTSASIQEFGLLWGLKEDTLTFKTDFDLIEAVLQDAEKKCKREGAVVSWLNSLRSASLEVDILLNEISTEALLQRLNKRKGIKYMVRAFVSSDHNQLIFRVRIAKKVKAIRKKLDPLLSMSSKLGLTREAINNEDVDDAAEMPERKPSYFVAILGRDDEIRMVINKICNKDIGEYDNDKISLYGIWGMGGVGKTTLARIVFQDKMVEDYFYKRYWVHVGKNFHVKKIMDNILKQLDTYGSSKSYLTPYDVPSILRQLNFLLVLDDVWIEDDEESKWDSFMELISMFQRKGSCIMVTSRSQTTCQMVAKVPNLQHHVGCLSKKDSWALFKMLAFEQNRDGGYISELKRIGREIVEKCEGVPLAVITFGRIMQSTRRNTSDWQLVKESNIFEMKENIELQEYNVLLTLKLSYDDLAPHEKQCFAYCCLFPRGYDMEKDTVIWLWVVSGFIPLDDERDLYEHGQEIFYRLLRRSFFQVVKDKRYSNDRYKVSGLMHDMARHVKRDEFLVIEPSKDVRISNEVLHLSSSCPDFQFSPQDLRKLREIKSVFMFGKEHYKCSISQIFNYVCLRVLYLSGIGLCALPESICELKHLEYLNLSHSSIEVLPESIMYLQNLQVLLLCFCYQLSKLPDGLRYMSSLRFLDINFCDSLLHLPFGIKELTRLQRLPRFPVGNNNGAKIVELKNLNLLEGELEMTPLENVGGLIDAKSANLKSKRKLLVLKLSWSNIYMRESKQEMFEYDEKILEGLEPNPSLRELKISFYTGKIISPSWMVNLENLVEIGFSGCKRCVCIPSLWKLPNLRVIKLLGMDSFEGFHDKDMTENTDMFFRLQEINIFMCPNLVSLPHNLPNLNILKLEECEALNFLPVQCFKGLKELEISGCKQLSQRYGKDKGVDWPKISHIPNIKIDGFRKYIVTLKTKTRFENDGW